MSKTLILKPLHQSLSAKFTSFSGYSMPVWYKDLASEHIAVRESAGIFDISHMGPITISGKGSKAFLQKMLTNQIEKCFPNKQIYHFILNEKGFVIDDVMVAYVGSDKFLLVANAVNKEQVLAWFLKHKPKDVMISRLDDSHCFFALQGPEAVKKASVCFGLDFEALEKFETKAFNYKKDILQVSRSGYTGEDGLEILLSNSLAEDFFISTIKQGFVPCGLAARDSLRIEAALPLYGHEFNLEIHPLQSRFGFALDFSKNFIGKEALLNKKSEGRYWVCAGFEGDGPRIPRKGYKIVEGGIVSSATKSPLTQKVIGMALIPKELKRIGQFITLDIRGTLVKAKLVKMPFKRT